MFWLGVIEILHLFFYFFFYLFCFFPFSFVIPGSALDWKIQKHFKRLQHFDCFFMWNFKTIPSHLRLTSSTQLWHTALKTWNYMSNAEEWWKKRRKKSIFPTLSLCHKCVEGVGLIEKLLIIRTMGSIELQKSCIRIHFPVWIVNNTKKKVWISVN